MASFPNLKFPLNSLLALTSLFPLGPLAAPLSFSPSPLDFGTIAVGESKRLVVTLHNNKSGSVKLLSSKLTNNPGDFSVVSSTCGEVMESHHDCEYTIQFKPRKNTLRTARLAVATGIKTFPDVKLTLKGNTYSILNDTGVMDCSDAIENGLACPQTSFPRQDAEYGRDVSANNNGNGKAGFNFTKLDAAGQPLPVNAAEWDCVRDNVTGLIWEIKTISNGIPKESLHDSDDLYTWYFTGATSQLNADSTQLSVCYGYDKNNSAKFCNTEAFISRVNTEGWCGWSDWRLPTRKELMGLLDYSKPDPSPTIDTGYFPDAVGDFYWTYSASVSYPSNDDVFWANGSWFVSFGDGRALDDYNSSYHLARLVRGGR